MRKTAQVGQRVEMLGWGLVEAVEIVVGDYRHPAKRYVRCRVVASGQRISSTEASFLKLLAKAVR